jgi:NADH-quinone oxidoreductase subunit H
MILIYSSLNILQVVLLQDNSFGIWNWLTFILFLISCLGETNRTPFDLSEAESELVSGYHTEHSALLFTYIFLAEYSFIIITSHLIVVLFLGGWLPFLIFNIEWFSYSIKLILVLFLFILIRATLPRYRYDQLMYLGWLVLLPLSFSCLFFDIFYLCIVNKFSTIYIYW